MELGGKVTIDCEKTNHRAELEFKLKVRDIMLPFITDLRLAPVHQTGHEHIHHIISVPPPWGGLTPEEVSSHSQSCLVQFDGTQLLSLSYTQLVPCQLAAGQPLLKFWQWQRGFCFRSNIIFACKVQWGVQSTSRQVVMWIFKVALQLTVTYIPILAGVKMNCTLCFLRLQDLASTVG